MAKMSACLGPRRRRRGPKSRGVAPVQGQLAPLQIRIATVMTGGVSLAVWMGGVAAELDALRRADPYEESPSKGGSVWGYGRLLQLLNCTVDFDVFAGTSAGGINAAANALAAATGGTTESLGQTWVEMGSLLDLLRSPLEKDPPSLMYGDRRLLEGLRNGLDGVRGQGLVGEREYPKLAITTTFVKGEATCFRDDFGTLVQDVDHRGLFTFTTDSLVSHGSVDALALAARSTASFPVAFEASRLPVGQAVDESHPDMSGYLNSTAGGWAIDGGLLANRPLRPALRWIFERPAQEQVRRVLAYVVPTSTTEAKNPSGGADDSMPNLIKTLTGAAGALMNQSIAAELDEINQHNLQVDAHRKSRSYLYPLASMIETMWEDYRVVRAEREAQDLLKEVDRQLMGASPPAAFAKEVEAVKKLEESPSAPRGWHGAAYKARLEIVAKRCPRRLEDLPRLGPDVFERSAVMLSVWANDLFGKGGDTAALQAVKKRIGVARDAVRSAREQKRGVQRYLSARLPGASDEKAVKDWIGEVAASWPYRRDEANAELETCWKALAREIKTLHDLDPKPAAGLAEYLGIGADCSVRLASLVVVEDVITPGRPKWDQRVELVQISADTRIHRSVDSRQRHSAAKKLTGLQLKHFGAFYRKSWRANDWMWGRLDGAGWIVHILLQPGRVRTLGATPEAIMHKLAGAVGADRNAAGESVTKELGRLLDPNLSGPDKTPAALPETALWVASAIQKRVAIEELPNVRGRLDEEPRGNTSEVFRSKGRVVTDENVADVLGSCVIGEETIAGEAKQGSTHFVQTASKGLATASAATQAAAGEKPPAALKPVLPVVRGATAATYVLSLGAGEWSWTLGVVGISIGLMLSTDGWVQSIWALMAGVGVYLCLLAGFARIFGKGMRTFIAAAISLFAVYVLLAPLLPEDLRIWKWNPAALPFEVLASALNWLQENWWAWLLIGLAVVGAVLRPWQAFGARRTSRMTQKQVQDAFVAYLLADGWQVSTQNRDPVDLSAQRGSEKIIAELKGYTTGPRWDVDAGYGELLRRVDPAKAGVRYALVVPASHRKHVTRVSHVVRERLGVEVFVVDEKGVSPVNE